jgi:hypothetical protein
LSCKIVEGQPVENVLKQVESEFSERITSANTANRASSGILRATKAPFFNKINQTILTFYNGSLKSLRAFWHRQSILYFDKPSKAPCLRIDISRTISKRVRKARDI